MRGKKEELGKERMINYCYLVFFLMPYCVGLFFFTKKKAHCSLVIVLFIFLVSVGSAKSNVISQKLHNEGRILISIVGKRF